jgi:hypothetical protein
MFHRSSQVGTPKGADVTLSGYASGVGSFFDSRNRFGRDDLIGTTDLTPSPQYRKAWNYQYMFAES